LIPSQIVWKALEKEIFAVLGMVTAKGEARTVGIVYIVHDGKIYISTRTDSWKERHIRANPHVSLTVPIHKSVPLMPWIPIPPATITFSGTARVGGVETVPAEALNKLLRGLVLDEATRASTRVIEVEPQGEFVTYGVGISLMDMRYPEKARGRAPVR
jgi:hypothetical protein